MSLSDWTAILGSKGTETEEWHTAGSKSYKAPMQQSVICHNKTLNDKPEICHIDFDCRFTLTDSQAGAVFKASKDKFIYIYFELVE